ncbi:hypothetical protein [Alistipes sp.]|uniref:hypothetical protein n=1 Tax=Alistipes sp. TaxID=1872444 RepID=UPI003AEF8EE3
MFTISESYETAAARLSFVMRAAGLGPVALARRLGLPDSGELYRVARSNDPIPLELARLIHEHYPQIDLEWLRSGKIYGKFVDPIL